MKRLIIIVSLALIFALSASVQATEDIKLTDAEDTYITNAQLFGDARGINDGGGELLLFGSTDFGDYITYIKFPELDEYIGKGGLVSADLILCRMPGNFSQTYGCEVFRVESDWEEYTATWYNQPTADRNISGTLSIPAERDEFSVDVTEIVRSWISGEYVHRGFAVYGTGFFPLALNLASSESSASEEFKELFKELGMSPPKLILKIDGDGFYPADE